MTKTITVTAVNDQPDVTVTNQTINEDAGAQTVTNFATPANGATQLEGSETFTYALTNNNNALFSAQPAIASNGTLTYTPSC